MPDGMGKDFMMQESSKLPVIYFVVLGVVGVVALIMAVIFIKIGKGKIVNLFLGILIGASFADITYAIFKGAM